MDKTVSIFRKTFFYSVSGVILVNLLFRLWPFIFALITSPGDTRGVIVWGLQSVYSMCLTSLFALTIPWFILSFYGEFFYTRSFNRNEIFKKVLDEYGKWFISFSFAAFLILFISNAVKLSDGLDMYRITFFLATATLYFTLIIAGNSKTLLKILLYGIPIVILRIILNEFNYEDVDLRTLIWNISWFGYLILCYRIVANYNDDVSINSIGKIDDENLSISNMWFFSKEFNVKPITLIKTNSYLSRLFSSFKMMTAQSRSIYIQISLIMMSLILFFCLKYAFTFIFIQEIDSFSDLTNNIFLVFGLLIVLNLIIGFINPKYLIISNEEFLLTRAVSKSKIYLHNFITQGICIILITLIYYFLYKFSFISFYIKDVNYLNIILSITWFYIAGEIGIVFLLLIFIFDTLMSSMNSGLKDVVMMGSQFNSELTVSFFINLYTTGIFSLSLWAGAIFFRIWDYRYFLNKELGWFKGVNNLIKHFAKNYVLPLAVLLSVTIITALTNPFTKYLNYYSHYDSSYLSSNIFGTLFFSPIDDRSKSFQKLMDNPYDKTADVDMAEDYVYSSRTEINFLSFRRESYYYNRKNFLGIEDNSSYYYLSTNDKGPNSILYWLNQAKELENTDKYLFVKSMYYYMKHDYDKALEFMEKAENITKNPEILLNLAIYYERDFKLKRAINLFNKVKNKDKKYEYFKSILLGDIYWNTEMYNQAIETFAKLVKYQDNYNDYTYSKFCNKLISVNIKNNITNLNLPLESFCQTEEIKNRYLKNIDIGKLKKLKVEISNTNYANYYLKKGDLNKAEAYFKKNITRYSPSWDNKGDLALLQVKLGKLAEAKSTIEIYSRDNHYLNDENPYRPFQSTMDYKIFLASLMLDKENKFDSAQKVIMYAPHSDEALLELSKFFDKSGEEYKNLVILKNGYDKLYKVGEQMGMELINNHRTFEISRQIIKRLKSKRGKDVNVVLEDEDIKSLMTAINKVKPI